MPGRAQSRRTIVWLSTALAGVLSVTACELDPPGRAPATDREEAQGVGEAPVLVVNDEPLTYAELMRRIDRLPRFAQAKYATIEARQEYLEALARFEIMADEAESQGLGYGPDATMHAKIEVAHEYLEHQLAQRVKLAEIDEKALRAAFEHPKSRWRRPPQRRVGVFVGSTVDEMRSFRDRILAAGPDAETRAATFGSLTKVHSYDKRTSLKGGDWGWLDDPAATNANNEGDRAIVAKQGFALAPDEVSGPFRLGAYWAIAMVYDERPVGSFEQAQDQIRAELFEQLKAEARIQILAELRKEADVDRVESVVAQIEAPPALAVPEDLLK